MLTHTKFSKLTGELGVDTQVFPYVINIHRHHCVGQMPALTNDKINMVLLI